MAELLVEHVEHVRNLCHRHPACDTPLPDNWLIGYDTCQLTQLAEQLYRELTKAVQLGTPPKILLAERNPVQFLAGFIAAVAAGCPVFLCNPDWVKAEWQQVFDLVQPDLIWGQTPTPPNPPLVRGGGKILTPSSQHALLLTPHSSLLTPNFSPLTPHPSPLTPNSSLLTPHSSLLTPHSSLLTPHSSPIMIPTGGSSGKIRFAIHTWETLMASVRGFQQYFQLKQVNSFCVLPLYHVSGLMQFMRSFTSGGNLVVMPFKALENGVECDIEPSEFFISLVPTQLQRILQNPELTSWLSRFQTVLLGGAPAWPELLEEARRGGIRLALTYGMTETASQIVTLKPEDFLNGNNSCGQVLPHAKVKIYNSSGEILGANQTGTIKIQADSLALGYYPELANQQHFPVDDVGFFDEHGYLNIIGRSSNKIITGGENVFPTEVEAAIRGTNLVADVCVMGLPDSHWGQVVAAVYVPKYPEVSPLELKAELENKLSKYKRPKYWLPVESMPRNAQGKVNNERLQQMVTAHLEAQQRGGSASLTSFPG